MSSIAEKLHAIVAQYRSRGLDNGDGMLPPADAAAIADAERSLGFRFPDSLRSVYAVFGGQEYITPGVTGIFGRHRLLSPAEIVKNYQMCQEVLLDTGIDLPPPGSLPGEDWEGWHPALIPFAGWDAYHLVMCRHTFKIWEFEPYIGLSSLSFKNMDEFLDAALQVASGMGDPVLDFNGD